MTSDFLRGLHSSALTYKIRRGLIEIIFLADKTLGPLPPLSCNGGQREDLIPILKPCGGREKLGEERTDEVLVPKSNQQPPLHDM